MCCLFSEPPSVETCQVASRGQDKEDAVPGFEGVGSAGSWAPAPTPITLTLCASGVLALERSSAPFCSSLRLGEA